MNTHHRLFSRFVFVCIWGLSLWALQQCGSDHKILSAVGIAGLCYSVWPYSSFWTPIKLLKVFLWGWLLFAVWCLNAQPSWSYAQLPAFLKTNVSMGGLQFFWWCLFLVLLCVPILSSASIVQGWGELRKILHETKEELKKVLWPSFQETVQFSMLLLGIVGVVGVLLAIIDAVCFRLITWWIR